MVVKDDSFEPPKNYRINYFILFFLLILIIGVPIFATIHFISSKLSEEASGDTYEKRIILLDTVRLTGIEKGILLKKIQKQLDSFPEIWGNSSYEVKNYYHSPFSTTKEKPPLNPNSLGQTPDLIRKTKREAKIINEAAYFSLKQLYHLSNLYYILPKGRPLAEGVGRITSTFGKRTNPLLEKSPLGNLFGKIKEFHGAIDLATRVGTPIYAPAPGIVIQVVTKPKSGYGKFVRIHHGFGYTTLYAHCNRILVETGQRVKRGQTIAEVGRTGRVTGAHLHYEMALGVGPKINPLPYMQLK